MIEEDNRPALLREATLILQSIAYHTDHDYGFEDKCRECHWPKSKGHLADCRLGLFLQKMGFKTTIVPLTKKGREDEDG